MSASHAFLACCLAIAGLMGSLSVLSQPSHSGGAAPKPTRESIQRDFLEALRVGGSDPSRIKEFLKQGVDIHAYTSGGITVLHEAARSEWAEVARLLIKAGANPNVRSKNILGETPLHVAASVGGQDGANQVLPILIAAGAKLNLASDREGRTALHMAASWSYPDNVKVLLKAGAKTDVLDHDGNTPLHLSLHKQDSNGLQILRMLLAAGASPHLANKNRQTPLHTAAYHGSLALVRTLLDAGAKPELQDESGDTPLHKAAGQNQLPVVRLLLKLMKPTAVAQRNREGQTALDSAARAGNAELIGLLMQAGLQPSLDQLIVLLDQGAHRAARVLTAQHPQLRQTLKPDLDAQRLEQLFPGRTRLMFERLNKRAFEIHALIFLGQRDRALAKLHEFDKTACGEATPLMAAVQDNRLEAARVLLELGADPNMRPPKPLRAWLFPAGPMSSSGISKVRYELPPPCEPFAPPSPVAGKPENPSSQLVATQRISIPGSLSLFGPPEELSLDAMAQHPRSYSVPKQMRSALSLSVHNYKYEMTRLLIQHGADPSLPSHLPPYESAQSLWLTLHLKQEDAARWQKVLRITDAQVAAHRK
jgi:ankyrin repeat protein